MASANEWISEKEKKWNDATNNLLQEAMTLAKTAPDASHILQPELLTQPNSL